MSLRPVSTNHKAEADRSSLENDRTSTYTTAPTHTLSGRDESLTLAETSDVHYSKRPSGKFNFSPISFC